MLASLRLLIIKQKKQGKYIAFLDKVENEGILPSRGPTLTENTIYLRRSHAKLKSSSSIVGFLIRK